MPKVRGGAVLTDADQQGQGLLKAPCSHPWGPRKREGSEPRAEEILRGKFPVLVVSALAVGPYLTVQKTVEHRHEEALKGRVESEVSVVPN